MSEDYCGPPIDDFTVTSRGVALPDGAFETPQERLHDLADEDFGLTNRGTVYGDYKSGLILADTYDLLQLLADEKSIRAGAFIKSVTAAHGIRRYIVDARRIRSLHLPTVNLGLDVELPDPMDTDRMRLRQKRFGTQLVSMMVVRDFDRVVGYGDADLQVPAQILCHQVDEFIYENQPNLSKSQSVWLPSADRTASGLGFHQFESSIKDFLGNTGDSEHLGLQGERRASEAGDNDD